MLKLQSGDSVVDIPLRALARVLEAEAPAALSDGGKLEGQIHQGPQRESGAVDALVGPRLEVAGAAATGLPRDHTRGLDLARRGERVAYAI